MMFIYFHYVLSENHYILSENHYVLSDRHAVLFSIIYCSFSSSCVKNIMSCQYEMLILLTRYYMLSIFIMSCQKPLCFVGLTCCLVKSLLYAVHFHYVRVLSENHYALSACHVMLFTRHHMLCQYVMLSY